MSIKKVIPFLFFLMVTSCAFAQKIVGFGEYKIGMSISEFLSVKEIENLRLKDKTREMYVPKDGDLWKTTSESNLEKYNKVYSPEVVKFEFNIATGVDGIGKDSYWTTVIFFKDKLAHISIYQPPIDFKKILTTKYGKPKVKDGTKVVVCQNGYGAKSEHFNGTITTSWDGVEGVTAELNDFWSGCGKISWSYTIEDKKVIAILNSIANTGEKRESDDDEKSKAVKSKL